MSRALSCVALVLSIQSAHAASVSLVAPPPEDTRRWMHVAVDVSALAPYTRVDLDAINNTGHEEWLRNIDERYTSTLRVYPTAPGVFLSVGVEWAAGIDDVLAMPTTDVRPYPGRDGEIQRRVVYTYPGIGGGREAWDYAMVSIPEPASGGMALWLALALLGVRRR